jgi:hypothetical protein
MVGFGWGSPFNFADHLGDGNGKIKDGTNQEVIKVGKLCGRYLLESA